MQEGTFTFEQAVLECSEIKPQISSPEKAKQETDEENDQETLEESGSNLIKQDPNNLEEVPAPTAIFRCVTCEGVFSSKRSLERHSRQHTDAKRDIFTCGQCGKFFYQKAHLTRHQIQQHTKQTRYTCPEDRCTYRCYYSSEMKSHYRSRHKMVDFPNVNRLLTDDEEQGDIENTEDSVDSKIHVNIKKGGVGHSGNDNACNNIQEGGISVCGTEIRNTIQQAASEGLNAVQTYNNIIKQNGIENSGVRDSRNNVKQDVNVDLDAGLKQVTPTNNVKLESHQVSL